VVSRNGLGGDEAIGLLAVANPITDDPAEISRILELEGQKALTAKGGTYTFGDPEPAQCISASGSHPGIRRGRTYVSLMGAAYGGSSCTFVAAGHAYKFSYLAPQSRIEQERPLLKRIMDATELTAAGSTQGTPAEQ
jgi:hypothetical protein